MRKLVLCVLLVMPMMISAGKIGGVELPETMSLAGETLQLNGMALRKKLWVKVYACGLYVKTKSADAAAIAAADEAMAIRMQFTYEVAADRLTGAWNDGFKASTGGNTAVLQEQIDAFNAMFTGKAKKGDVYEFHYVPGEGVTFAVNGTSQGSVKGLAFKQALFGIWLGKKLADGNLKDMKKGLTKI